jgi:hypothetical protein
MAEPQPSRDLDPEFVALHPTIARSNTRILYRGTDVASRATRPARRGGAPPREKMPSNPAGPHPPAYADPTLPRGHGRAGVGAEGPVRVCTDYRKASATDMATFCPARWTGIAISASFIDDMTMMVFATSHV